MFQYRNRLFVFAVIVLFAEPSLASGQGGLGILSAVPVLFLAFGIPIWRFLRKKNTQKLDAFLISAIVSLFLCFIGILGLQFMA
jgi:L-lactate permease